MPKSPSPKPDVKAASGKTSPDKKGGKKKKDKKKFTRHKVRSDSPDKEFYETVGDPAETQVVFLYNKNPYNVLILLFKYNRSWRLPISE